MIRFSLLRRLQSGGRWLLLFPLIALFFALWGARNYFAPPAFSATALTQVNPDNVATELGMPQNTRGVNLAQQNVDHLNDLLGDDLPGGFMDTVLKQSQPSQSISLDPASQDPRLAKMLKGLFITPQSSTVYAINVVWDNPDECRRIADAFRARYIAEVGAERHASSIATSMFLDRQMGDYVRRMRKEEQILIDYRSHNLDGHLEEQTADISKLSGLRAQLDDMRISQQDASVRHSSCGSHVRLRRASRSGHP